MSINYLQSDRSIVSKRSIARRRFAIKRLERVKDGDAGIGLVWSHAKHTIPLQLIDQRVAQLSIYTAVLVWCAHLNIKTNTQQTVSFVQQQSNTTTTGKTFHKIKNFGFMLNWIFFNIWYFQKYPWHFPTLFSNTLTSVSHKYTHAALHVINHLILNVYVNAVQPVHQY